MSLSGSVWRKLTVPIPHSEFKFPVKDVWIIVCSKILFINLPDHVETIQSICRGCQWFFLTLITCFFICSIIFQYLSPLFFYILFLFPLLFLNLRSPWHILQFSYNAWFYFSKTRIRLLDFITIHHIENNNYSVSTIFRYFKYIIGRYWHPGS